MMSRDPHRSRDPKGAGVSTVGYPSDSLASCKLGVNLREVLSLTLV